MFVKFSSPCRRGSRDFHWNERTQGRVRRGISLSYSKTFIFYSKISRRTYNYLCACIWAPVSVNLRNIRHTYSYVHILETLNSTEFPGWTLACSTQWTFIVPNWMSFIYLQSSLSLSLSLSLFLSFIHSLTLSVLSTLPDSMLKLVACYDYRDNDKVTCTIRSIL